MIMDNADGCFESEFKRPARNRKSIFWITNTTSEDRVDIDVELGMFGQPLKRFVEDLQALFRDVIGPHIIDADLQMFKTGPIGLLVNPPPQNQAFALLMLKSRGNTHAVDCSSSRRWQPPQLRIVLLEPITDPRTVSNKRYIKA